MLAALMRGLDRTVEFVLFLIFLAFTLVGGLQIFNRFALGLPLSWSEEFQKFGHIWMVFLAIPVAYRHGAHLGMDMLYRLMPQRLQWGVQLVIELLWLLLGLAIGWYTFVIMRIAQFQESPGLGWRMDHVYLGLVLGAIYLVIVALRRLAAAIGIWHEPAPAPLGGHE